MTTLLEKIRDRGHWQVVVRPARFMEKRMPDINVLYPLVQKTSVQFRGWDFPHIGPHTRPHVDLDWVGQESEWNHFLELWRLYQSGQFVDIAGMSDDWLDQRSLWPVPKGWKPNAELGVVETIYHLTEIMEFAARLALTDAGDKEMHLKVTIRGLHGRRLAMDDSYGFPLLFDYRANIAEFPAYDADIPRSDLVATASELALVAARELFARFRWDVSLDTLRHFQAGLKGRSRGS